jgi:hypothetical protein
LCCRLFRLYSHFRCCLAKEKDRIEPQSGNLVENNHKGSNPVKWSKVSVPRTSLAASHFTKRCKFDSSYFFVATYGGSEFESIFEDVCQRRDIRLFVLPPRSPKLNGGLERAHRTHTEEFYEVTDSTFELAELRQGPLEWETTYNTVRPHQAL